MKKITLLLSAVLIFTLSFYSCEQSQIDPLDPEASSDVVLKPFTKMSNSFEATEVSCGDENICDLHAGSKDRVIGDVSITNDNEYLYIKVYSEIGFNYSEEYNLKIFVGTDYNDIPLAGNGAPINGHFPYKAHVAQPEKTYTMRIELSTIDDWLNVETENQCGPNLFVVVHADIPEEIGGDSTAYGGCIEGEGNRWWWYNEYTPACCCFCGFSFDNQNYEEESCMTMMYEGTPYKFWSNNFMFEDIYSGNNTHTYEVSLVANSKTCMPLDADGNKTVSEDYMTLVVGTVILTVKTSGDGGSDRVVDITYNLKDKYKYYNIQLDLYIGADRKPLGYDIVDQTIETDELHMLYQHELGAGETTYTFENIPWLTHEGSSETFIALHAAIGDCPMPSLQNPM